MSKDMKKELSHDELKQWWHSMSEVEDIDLRDFVEGQLAQLFKQTEKDIPYTECHRRAKALVEAMLERDV